MDLIAINKILEYISARPESQTAFLTFLKEYEHEFRKRFEQANGFNGAGVGAGAFSLGTGEYVIEYEWRAQLNAIYITWLGSREEHQAYIKDKLRMMQPAGREFIVEHVVSTVSGGRTSTKRTVVPYDDAIEPTIPQPLMVAEFEADSYQKTGEALSTRFEYEQALGRTMSIFSAEPTTPEFAELKLLITAIKTYEAQYVKFPELRLLELINHRMAMFGLAPENLARFFDTQENTDLFFAGRKQLTKGKLQKLFKMLSIKIPVSEFE